MRRSGGRCTKSTPLLTELQVQACRALGNLCYGWDVEPIKAAIGERGATTMVQALQR